MAKRAKDSEVTWMAQCLLDSIGARVLSRLSDADGPLGSYAWPEPTDPGPDASQAARVRVAFATWKMLDRHGDDFVMGWLLTLNPLVGQRPADAIAADDFAAVLVAAQMVRNADALDEDDDEDDDEEDDGWTTWNS
ncbi:hypothetical protein [Leifsonia virtsii]|uniref:Antitoxin Xre/MbcA/ParS-like toxin-binding domain-containing protein n=1 Tax=Leifsonia virtsii TaxID=3035915 RepID=A0ABT8IYZ0_9MICO|nr:hypothetical protein [Leifsonia virtsii]MDN4598040.1 hypothetical protein [Leifsonia virtsii]